MGRCFVENFSKEDLFLKDLGKKRGYCLEQSLTGVCTLKGVVRCVREGECKTNNKHKFVRFISHVYYDLL